MPLYIVALLSAVMVGIAGYQSQNQLFAASWILLGFGLFAYVMGLAEDLEPCLWLLPVFATWSLIDSAQLSDLYRPPTIALVFAGVGVSIGLLKHIPLPFFGMGWRNRLQAWHPQGVPLHFKRDISGVSFLEYALPFYAVAFVAAVLTGVYGMLPGANPPLYGTFLYGAIPDVLLIYALAAFGVVLFERQRGWLWLVAGFASWGTLLATQLSIYCVAGTGLGAGIVGLLLGWFVKQRAVNNAMAGLTIKFSWGWPWYLTALAAAVVVGTWPVLQTGQVGFSEIALLAFAVLAYIVGVVEDLPGVLWLTPVFAAWSLTDFARLNQFYPLPIVALVGAASGMITRSLNLSGLALPGTGQHNRRLKACEAVLYLTALVAAVLTGSFFRLNVNYPFFGAVAATMLLYAAVASGVILFEQVPELLVLPACLAALAVRLWQPYLDFTSLMIAYSILCVLIFASQFVWKILSPVTRWIPASLLHNILGIGGQLGVGSIPADKSGPAPIGSRYLPHRSRPASAV